MIDDDKKKLSRAILAGKKRDYTKAISLLESIDEPSSLVFLYLGRAWHAQKNFPRAIYYLNFYTERKKEDASGWFFLARSYCASGLYVQAVRAVKKSLLYKNDARESLSLLAFTYLKAKQSTLAREAFEHALSYEPDDKRLLQGYYNTLFIDAVRTLKKGESNLARQMFAFLLDSGMEAVIIRLYYAHALREEGLTEEALEQYRAASRLEPDDTSLRWYEVSALFSLNRKKEAQSLLFSLQEEDSSSDMAQQESWTEQHIDIRIVRQNVIEGKWQNALQAARLYIKTYGSDVIIHTLMGEIFRNTGNFDNAENHFKRACEFDPNNPAALYGLLMVLHQKKDFNGIATIVSQNNASSILDADTKSYYMLMCMAQTSDNSKDIIKRVQKLISSHPSDTDLFFILATHYLKIGLIDLAQKWYVHVLERKPLHEEAFLGYIACLEYEENEHVASHTAHNTPNVSEIRISDLYEAYQKYLSSWQDNSEIRLDFIYYLEKKELWEEAADEAERLISFVGSNESLERHVALYRRKAGQYRTAAVLYQSLAQKNQNDVVLLHNLAYCLDKLGFPDIALQMLQTKVKTSDIETMLIEASLLLKQHKTEAALDIFRHAHELYPNDYRIPLKMSLIYEQSNVLDMSSHYKAIAESLRRKAVHINR